MSDERLDWSDCPRKPGKLFPWKLIRTPKGGYSLQATVVSPLLVGCWTHFYDGRTYPHRVNDCPACEANMKREWHGYFAAIRDNDAQKIVVEVTERVGAIIEKWQSEHRTLRGTQIQLSRVSKVAHARIDVKFRPVLADTILHVPSAELKEILCHIWKQPTLLASSVEESPPKIHEPETGGPAIILPERQRNAG